MPCSGSMCSGALGRLCSNLGTKTKQKLGLKIRNVYSKDIIIRIRMNCFTFTYRRKLLLSEAKDTQDPL